MVAAPPVLTVFIDTNVFLSFYHYTSDALDHLERLAEMAQNQVRLLVPEQVCDEFYRDRDIKLSDTLKRLGDAKVAGQYPHAFKQDGEYEELRRLETEYGKTRARIVARFQETALAGALKADEVIHQLFDAAIRIGVDDGILRAAEVRRRRGNPPGKRDSLGDQINWEALLTQAGGGGDLYIVSVDRDWRTPLDEHRIHPYLDREWNNLTGGAVHLYEDVASFFSDQIPALEVRDQPPDISSEEEADKNRLIATLQDSPTFQTTHSVIAQLERFTDFTRDQLNLVLRAYATNTQVSWIINDRDVRAFLDRLLEGRQREVDQQLLSAVRQAIEESD